MPNSKTAADGPRKPRTHNGWVRKHELDAWLDRFLPIPTQVVSNEEYDPPPQSREQKLVEQRICESASRHASRLGITRRDFLRTSCGMAASFAAMNSVFGEFFTVEAAELLEPAATAQKATKFFIFDVQTHHVATPTQVPGADKDFLGAVVSMRKAARNWNPELKATDPRLEEVYLENYIKEVFLDSETDLVVLSALPSETEDASVIPPDMLVKSRDVIGELSGSKRVIAHGYFSPDQGARNLENMQVQAEKYKVEAWKGYTGTSRVKGRDGWRVDDEKEAYPALEYARKSGIKNICLHKGLPFPGPEEVWSPRDVVKAAKDFPDLNFLVYHSGFKGVREGMAAVNSGFEKPYVPWVSDMCEWRRTNSHMKNVYMELGSTFGMMVSASPPLAAHVLGMIIQAFGDDHVLWGTDSIWWGSPQWQIEAMRRLQMPENLMKKLGYKPLSDDVKAKIFGLNAAKVYGVDPNGLRKPIPTDYVDRLRKMYKESGMVAPSNTQYGWVRAL